MKKKWITGGLAVVVVALGVVVFSLYREVRAQSLPSPVAHATEQVVAHPKPIITSHNAPPPNPTVFDGVKMRYNPLQPSDGPYPVLHKGEKIWIDVSIKQQLVYLFHGSHRIYTMATSSGMQSVKGDGSPPGIYHIQAERGRWFYVPRYHEGAKYWVSWLGHGLYLFHSVPMTRNKKIIPAIAAKLLHEASHGCFHLTVADAKWFYKNVPYGTTVIVERAPLLLEGNSVYHPTPVQRRAIKATLPAAQTASLAEHQASQAPLAN